MNLRNVGFSAIGFNSFAFGLFQSNNVDTVTIGLTPVPEPLTMLGAATALGFGTAFRRKLTQKKSQA